MAIATNDFSSGDYELPRRVTRSMTTSVKATGSTTTTLSDGNPALLSTPSSEIVQRRMKFGDPLELNTRSTKRKITPSNTSTAASSIPLSKLSKRIKTDSKGTFRDSVPVDALTFGLIQERLADNLYHLIIQAILWNQTSGYQARPVFYKLIERYPTPSYLASASLPDLTALLQPLGLHNIRAKRCIDMAKVWLERPPDKDHKYKRKGYPTTLYGNPNEEVEFEIAHLPGVGPYALDSYRIFHRDRLRGIADDWLGHGAKGDSFEPEWKRVIPLDKELRPYLAWLWLKEDIVWDPLTGNKSPCKM